MRIRLYRESDAADVGRLIADTYREFNLSHADPAEQERLLGPFRNAHSADPDHCRAIVEVLRSPMLYVAEVDGHIVGVLRGREGVLASLFVDKRFHRRGMATALVERFEKDSRAAGTTKVRVAASIYAVPFYQRMGYVRTTGVRPGRSFEGTDFTYQPMRKRLT